MSDLCKKPLPAHESIVEIGGQFYYWPHCRVMRCTGRVCFGLGGETPYCFPHSAEFLNIKPHFDYDVEKLVEFKR
jgi:hypothetical protein